MNSEQFKKLSKEEKAKVKFKDLPTINKMGFGCFIFVIIFILMVIFIPMIGDEEMPTIDEAQKASERIISRTLIDPTSSEFIKENVEHGTLPDSTYIFVGYVKALNKLGLKAPHKYRVEIKWTGGSPSDEKSWYVKDLKFE